jgi:hypothetical protein
MHFPLKTNSRPGADAPAAAVKQLPRLQFDSTTAAMAHGSACHERQLVRCYYTSASLLVSPDTCDVPGTPRRNYTHEAPLLTNVVEGLSPRQTRAVPLLKTARCTLSSTSASGASLLAAPERARHSIHPHAGGDDMTVVLRPSCHHGDVKLRCLINFGRVLHVRKGGVTFRASASEASRARGYVC